MKKETSRHSFKPSVLRILLALSFLTILGLHILATVIGQHLLRESSKSVTEAITSMQTTQQALSQLQQTEKLLATKKNEIKASRKLVGQIKEYAYQKQIIHDAIAYGRRVGLGITGFNFESTGGPTNSTNSPSRAGIPGVTSHPVSVTTTSPTGYVSLLHFLSYIEGNLTQIHLDNISLTSPYSELEGSSSQGVEIPAFNLEVYTK